MEVLPACLSVYHMHAWFQWKSGDGIGCEMPDEGSELNQGYFGDGGQNLTV